MKNGNQVAKAFVLVLQIGLTMMTSIGICGAVGYGIYDRFDCNLMIFFIAFGVVCGYSASYSLIRQHIDMRSSQDRYAQMFSQWEDVPEAGLDAALKGEDDDEDKALHE